MSGDMHTPMQGNSARTIFHVTHWKAGSQWIYKILRDAAPNRHIVAPDSKMSQFMNKSIIPGAIYPTLYLDRAKFLSRRLPENSEILLVIRDLRDTLVSAYFSLKYSHVLMGSIPEFREKLEKMSVEDGLLMLMQDWLPAAVYIQKSWLDSGQKFIRYEDLLIRDVEILETILIDRCKIDLTPERLRQVVINSRFESLTGGRERGTEDIMAHERKGVSGDWQNYFTPRVTKEFNDQFGGLLQKAGYEPAEL